MSPTTTRIPDYQTTIANFLQQGEHPLVDGPLHLTAFHTSHRGFTRNTYVGIINNDGTNKCIVTEAAGPVQALLHMLDEMGYHLEIVTFRQRPLTSENNTRHPGNTRYLSAIEIDNGRFTHWSLGTGKTSADASHQALINAANALHSARTLTPERIANSESGDAPTRPVTASELTFRRTA